MHHDCSTHEADDEGAEEAEEEEAAAESSGVSVPAADTTSDTPAVDWSRELEGDDDDDDVINNVAAKQQAASRRGIVLWLRLFS